MILKNYYDVFPVPAFYIYNKNIMSYFDIEHWTKKGMSESDAFNKVKDLKERTNRYCVEHWIRKGLTELEAKEKISEIQKENSSKVDTKNRPTSTRLDYWLNKGYNIEDAKVKLKERQSTFSLDICIKKHGEIEGKKIFKKRQKKWQKTLNDNNNKIELNKKRGLTKEQFIEKHGKEKYKIYAKSKGLKKEEYIKKFGLEKYNEKINNTKNVIRLSGFNKYSKISMEFFLEIEKNINIKCYFGKEEKIIQFYDNDGKYFCFYVDFLCDNKIIEFYGDYYHANPNLYEANKIVGSKYKFFTAGEIWERDFKRIKIIEEKGYDVLIVWENEYKKNKEEIKNKCIKWIKNL